MENKQIALMGANSHIAKGLIENFISQPVFELHLFIRKQDQQDLFSFLKLIGAEMSQYIQVYLGYEDFFSKNYDVIINCVGIGTKNEEDCDYSDYFTVTEEYDNLAINYLRRKNSQTIYISFSSGVIYGGDFSEPATDETANQISVNGIKKSQYYSIARLNAETKHRAFEKYNIVDLRIFSYFSKFIDLRDNYFITELINCVLQKKIFYTNSTNFIRDYLHPLDLFHAIRLCLEKEKINSCFDIFSLKPVSKEEILGYFSQAYGLKYRTTSEVASFGGTGSKLQYYSLRETAMEIGYTPEFTSLQALKSGMESILKINHN